MSISLETLALAKKYTRKYVGEHGGGGGEGGDGTSGTYGSITLSASWNGSNPYIQTVTADGYTTTAQTKVDLLADSAIIDKMVADGVNQIYVENDNGVLTAYAVGGKPTTSMVVQAVFSEVK